MEKVICVLVLYNPSYNLTYRVIESILPQVDLLFISDNSTTKNEKLFLQSDKIIYQKMDGNIGIAAAQNVGIEYGIRNNYKYLFFLDQDSICPYNIISLLIDQFEKLNNAGYYVGAIGPRAINRSTGKQYRGIIRPGIKINPSITEVSELISSASLINMQLFRKVGYMDDSLFIDGVDHEWCWRARSKVGCHFFIAENVLLSHQLGEGDRYLLWKKVAIPTPFRTYYQFRNYFILCSRSYVPIYWKVVNGIKYMIKILYFPLFISPRFKYVQNIARGIYEGIKFIIIK